MGNSIKNTFKTNDINVFNDNNFIGCAASHNGYEKNFGCIHKREIFFDKVSTTLDESGPLDNTDLYKEPAIKTQDTIIPFEENEPVIEREPASLPGHVPKAKQTIVKSVFQDMETLNNALITNNHA